MSLMIGLIVFLPVKHLFWILRKQRYGKDKVEQFSQLLINWGNCLLRGAVTNHL